MNFGVLVFDDVEELDFVGPVRYGNHANGPQAPAYMKSTA
ncbi:MAG: hypothetical protein JWP52_911 [Rhizobacter sp.]|nr:hypothetical protein [Rhizobacter sp.]